MGQMPASANPPVVPVVLVLARAAAARPGDATIAGDAADPPAEGAGRPAIDTGLVQAMVASAVRRVLDDPLTGPAASDEADDGDAAPPSPVDLAAAVVAAHDQRIALLRERLDALCGADAASALLPSLRIRLARAEAARALAAARTGVAAAGPGQARGCSIAGKTPDFISTRTVRLAAVIHSHPLPSTKASVRSVAMRHAATVQVGIRHRPPAPRLAEARRWRAPYAVRHALAVRTATLRLIAVRGRRYRATGSGAVHLAAARRSLAAARRALVAAPLPPRQAVIGLWRLQGGDRWQLVAGSAPIG